MMQLQLNGKTAVLVIDMLEDFVNGPLSCPQARAIVPHIAQLLSSARAAGVPVFYCCDNHTPTDHELTVWPPHAMSGTPGAQIIQELSPASGDTVVPKHSYSGFFQTSLQTQLQQRNIRSLILCGLYTNICVRHTAADAYLLGYPMQILQSCVSTFTPQEFEADLTYLQTVYGVQILKDA